MSLKFKPEDFQYLDVENKLRPMKPRDCTVKAQALFDAWLESQPKVYGAWTPEDLCRGTGLTGVNHKEGDTHTARLCDVREIEK